MLARRIPRTLALCFLSLCLIVIASSLPLSPLTPTAQAVAEQWTEIVTGSISERDGHTAICHCDGLNHRMIVFGGGMSSRKYNDVWALDLDAGSETWHRIDALGTPPTEREDHTAIYDTANQRMIVFGGADNTAGALNDLWSLDLSTPKLEAWRPITATSPTRPDPRWSASAIYDPINQRMILFGGGSYFNDTWALDLSVPGAEVWTRLAPSGTPPYPRRDHTAIYDPGDPNVTGDERMIVWGGSNFDPRVFALELGTAGAESWSTLAVSGSPPVPRVEHSATYDPVNRRMVIFGGHWSNNRLNDVATLLLVPGAESWRLLAPGGASPPTARRDHTAVYDPIHHRLVVFGGDGEAPTVGAPLAGAQAGARPAPTTTGSSEAAPGAWSPLGKEPSAAVPDGSLGPADHAGTFKDDVWKLDLTLDLETWTGLGPFGPPVSPRSGHTAICHCTDTIQRMIVFGKGGGSDVWSLPLNVTPYTWYRLRPAGTGPGSLQHQTAIYDAANQRMIVFGGSGSSDVWALNLTPVGGESWVKLNPSGIKPVGRFGHSAVYDSDREQMVIFGGGTTAGLFNDVWALHLSPPGSESWRPIALLSSIPTARTDHSAVYDRVNQRMVVFGGSSATLARLNDVWALDLTTPGSETWTRLAQPATSITVRGKAPGVYYYRVKASNDEGDSPYSAIQAVVVTAGVAAQSSADAGSEAGEGEIGPLAVPPAPVLNPISNPDGDGTYQVTWERSPGAIFYTLEEDTSPFFPVPTVYLPGAGGALPMPRADHAAIYDEYDPNRPRMVVFGGEPSAGQLNDIWELSLVQGQEAWRELTPIGNPPSVRGGHTAICHCMGDYYRMVIFGGVGGNLKNDTWVLDLATAPPGWSHLPLVPLGDSPPARHRHSAIYDADTRRMVVFGGLSDDATYLNDVWVLNLLPGNVGWRQMSPTDTPPTPRADHSAIYDAANRRMIVFGGHDDVVSFNQVWALHLVAGSEFWYPISPTGTPPSVRNGHTAVYDADRQRMVVFGGRLSTLTFNDAWALSLRPGVRPAWTYLGPLGTRPSARFGHAAVRDVANDRMIVFGGQTNPALNDTWSLTGTWTALAPVGSLPPTRTLHSAIYDAPNGRMVVFGGESDSTRLRDVWTLDLTSGSESWVQITPTGVITPEARSGHTAIYDEANDQMILFGGKDGFNARNDVWALDLTAGSEGWTRLAPGSSPIPALSGHSAVYDDQDPARPRMVVFGGAPATVEPAAAALLDRTPAAEEMDLSITSTGLSTSLQTTFNDLWALDLRPGLEGWYRIYPNSASPSPRAWHSAIVDEPHNRMIVFGGRDRWQPFNDVWALDLTMGAEAWTRLTPTGTPPSARWGHSAVYDALREQMVIFAGGISNNEVWALDLSTPGAESWRLITPSLTTVMFSLSNRAPGTYYYRVRGVNVEATGPWSNIRSTVVTTTNLSALSAAGREASSETDRQSAEAVLVPPPPPAPVLFLINNPDGDGHYVISWSHVLTATGYTLQEDTNPDFFHPISVDLTTGTPPGYRTWHTAFMDEPNNRMFIFGGSGGSHVHLNDLWALHLQPGAESWTRVVFQGDPPPVRLGHTTILDEPNQRAVVFGGKTYREDPRQQARLNDAWAAYPDQWTWSQLRPLHDPPGERQWHTAIYDAGNRRMVVFGGDGPTHPAMATQTTQEPDDTVWILSLPAAPIAPADLMTTSVSATQIDLAWTDTSGDETNFRVQRSPNGETAWQEIASLPANTTTFSDTSVICGVPYFYRVVAYRAATRQFSRPSNVVGATPACPAALMVWPPTLGFTLPRDGGNPGAKSLSVYNAGSGNLTWKAESPVPWLSISPGDGLAPTMLTVQVDASSLSVTTHTTSITVRSLGSPALRSPQTIAVAVCPAMREDVIADGVIDVNDLMAVAAVWGCDSCYTAGYDMEPDGDVDIVDLMLMITKWGTGCSG